MTSSSRGVTSLKSQPPSRVFRCRYVGATRVARHATGNTLLGNGPPLPATTDANASDVVFIELFSVC